MIHYIEAYLWLAAGSLLSVGSVLYLILDPHNRNRR